MKSQMSIVKYKQLFYLYNNNGIVSTYFLDRLADPFALFNVKNWSPRVVSMVSIYSSQTGQLAPATDQYQWDK